MLEVLQTAVHGLRLAEGRAATAAHNIATAPYNAADAGGASAGGGETPAAVTPASGSFLEGQGYSANAETDLARNLVDLQIAQHAYKANAAVIRAANEAFEHLLDSFA